jgi:hypothetical protein
MTGKGNVMTKVPKPKYPTDSGIEQRMFSAVGKVGIILADQCDLRCTIFEGTFSRSVDVIRKHVMQNWDKYVDLLVDNAKTPADKSEVLKLPDMHRLHEVTQKMLDAVKTGGVVVFIENDMYATYQISTQVEGPAVIIYTTETLPNKMKRAVGLLKLIEDKAMIEGVGFRVDETTYYLVEEAL